jgi:hypothetical protein
MPREEGGRDLKKYRGRPRLRYQRNARKCTSSKGDTPRTRSGGAVFVWNRFPRVRKKRVPGANLLARLQRAQPGGLLGN